ncbi:MAG: DUF3450 family protein [Spirochaetales bacterium]|nr:DUF3450 family protein [Spirochaetales bacterium]
MNRTGIMLLLMAAAWGAVFAQTNQEALENMAASIAQKRAEAETLNNELDVIKAGFNEELRSIATQQADIQARINRQQLQFAQLERELAEHTQRIAQSSIRMDELKPVILEVLGYLREYISSSLPFHTEDRLNELDSLERVLTSQRLLESEALARMWNIMEEEARLCRESGLYRQTISLHGEDQLAEVARLGMVLLYFKTFDGVFGYALRNESVWTYVEAGSREDAKNIENLFVSLKKNLREGYFELPIPGGREKGQWQ